MFVYYTADIQNSSECLKAVEILHTLYIPVQLHKDSKSALISDKSFFFKNSVWNIKQSLIESNCMFLDEKDFIEMH